MTDEYTTNEHTTQEADSQQQEETSVTDLYPATIKSQGARIRATLTKIERYIGKFEESYQRLHKAAQTFRNKTDLLPREVGVVTTALQELRELTGSCLDFLESRDAYMPISAIELKHELRQIDGSKTARLILEVDLFDTLLCRSGFDEKLSHARERINMHVSLQDDLKSETKSVQRLITLMKNTVEEVIKTATIPIPR